MKLLDLYCGSGGASKGYVDAGWEVTGVDILPMSRYPYKFIQADAIEYLRENWLLYDLVHASPPCQLFSPMMRMHPKRIKNHKDWITPTRELLLKLKIPYVIENVETAPLRKDLLLCGTMFGKQIRRHRVFEFSGVIKINSPGICNHSIDDYSPFGKKRNADRFRDVMEIDWMVQGGGNNKRGSLDEAIPPYYTYYIGRALLDGWDITRC